MDKQSKANHVNEDQVEEELEPLFNYSHLPPAHLLAFADDRFDSSPVFHDAKRKKCTTAAGKEVKGGGKSVVVLDDDNKAKNKVNKNADVDEKLLDDDLDWLPPPPKVVNPAGVGLKEDKTMQELRLKKQELASFTQSAQDVLQQIVEAAEKEVSDSRKNAALIVLDEPTKQQNQRPKIVISIMDKAGQKQFRIYMDDKLEKVFKLYADRAQLKLENLVFSFDGDKVSANATPNDLGLEDNDVIEVNVKS